MSRFAGRIVRVTDEGVIVEWLVDGVAKEAETLRLPNARKRPDEDVLSEVNRAGKAAEVRLVKHTLEGREVVISE